MAHPVNWFQIDGLEGEALADFYGKVFRWKMKKSPDGSMMMAAAAKGGIPGGIGPSRGKSQVAIYVAVPDIDKQLAAIETEGGKTAMPKVELPSGMGSIAGFTDPAGNFIGLWQQAKKSKSKKSAEKAGSKKPDEKGSSKKSDAKKDGKKSEDKGKGAGGKPDKKADKKSGKGKDKGGSKSEDGATKG